MASNNEEIKIRTIEQITAENLIVRQMDKYIEENGGDPKDTLQMEVLRSNFISHEKNNDSQVLILDHIKISKKNPSLLWLFRYKTLPTITAILTGFLFIYVILRLIEVTVGLEKILESVVLP